LWQTARAPLFVALVGVLPAAVAAMRYPVYLVHAFPNWWFPS
jgi:hypothetical protein